MHEELKSSMLAVVPVEKPETLEELFKLKAALVTWVMSAATPENKQLVLDTALSYYDKLTAGDTIQRLPDFIEMPLESALRNGLEAVLRSLLSL